MHFQKELLITLSLILLSACGKEGENSSVLTSTDVTQMSVVVEPPKDVLYIPSFEQKAEFVKSTGLKASPSSNVYIATGNGGVGEQLAFDSQDSLTVYTGIPVSIKGVADSKLKVLVTSSGDRGCFNLFTYDEATSQIQINPTSVTSLVICTVHIHVTADVQGTPMSSQTSFEVALNPTLKAYYESEDKFINYLMYYSGYSSSPNLKKLAKWIKKSPKNNPDNSENDVNKLYLKYNSSLSYLDQINAITGAKSITGLDLSGSQVQDIRALRFLPNLQELNLSNTRISQRALAQLSILPNLKKLTVQNISLQDMKSITENLKNLEYLDISNNNKVFDLSSIKNLKNLKTLIASNISLTKSGFNELVGANQITSLDLSKNDLSFLTKEDTKTFLDLFSIQELNVSETKVSDEFLNTYFSLIATRNTLKKFVDRNTFYKSTVGDCDKINSFSDAKSSSKIGLLTNLEYLDVHGNSCIKSDGLAYGTTKLDFISSLINLTYLDISNNHIQDLSSLANKTFEHLPFSGVIMDDLGSANVPLTQEACETQLEGSIYSVDCLQLTAHSKPHMEIYKPGSYQFVVPINVKQLTITGCSGANGGAAGGGGGAGATIFGGNWYRSSWGGDGAASGNINGLVNNGAGTLGTVGYCISSSCAKDHQANSGSPGGNGGVGAQTYFGLTKFSVANSYTGRDPTQFCLGGSNGHGGLGGEGVKNSSSHGGHGGNGGTNHDLPWSTNIETYVLNVTPGQIIPFMVGLGGTGGSAGLGGGPQGNGGQDAGMSSPGLNGISGTPGENGFLKVSWEQ